MESPSNNDWRKLTAVVYRKPRDSKIFGSVEFDVTELEAFVNERRRDGLKITLTHIFLLAFARGLKDAAPEINCYVRRGSIIQRNSVDVSLTVLIKGGQLSSVKVVGAENLTLQALSTQLQTGIQQLRKGQDAHFERAKNLLVRLPWPLRQWVADLVKRLTIDWGISLPFLGVSPDSFGSFVLSNLGSIGLDVGYPSLAPFSNVSMVVIQGGVTLKPVVVDGQIVPRRMITFSAALDHRVVDAAQIGRLFNYVRRVLKKPELLM
ncbi:MAG: 2-oxo acid dehydrogenase subunit E2 [Phycisphaerae bacterium]|nr:2-oxo acid dehydrogenase subunit E2 [Saprospiraceae bacterium]